MEPMQRLLVKQLYERLQRMALLLETRETLRINGPTELSRLMIEELDPVIFELDRNIQNLRWALGLPTRWVVLT